MPGANAQMILMVNKTVETDLKFLVGEAAEWTAGTLYSQMCGTCGITHLKIWCEHTPPELQRVTYKQFL